MYIIKLDGVGPVDNRPSTDKLHHFVRIFFSSSFKWAPSYRVAFFSGPPPNLTKSQTLYKLNCPPLNFLSPKIYNGPET